MQSTDNLTREAHLQRRVALVPAPDSHIRRMLAWSPTRDVARNSKAPGNGHKIVGQQLPTLLYVTCCVHLHTLVQLHVVACCWEFLRKVWNRSNFWANDSRHFKQYQLTTLKYTYQGMASTLHMRTTISPGRWQPWTAVSPLLELRAKQLFMAANPRVILVVRMLKVLAIP